MSKRKIFVTLVAAILISFLFKEYRMRIVQPASHKKTERELRQFRRKDSLRCTIYIPTHAGSRVGYHYEIIRRFAGSHDLVLQYVPAEDSVAVWDLLSDGHTDLLAVNIIRDPVPKNLTGKVFITPQITPLGEVWVMMKERFPWHLSLVHWLTLFKQSPEFSRFRNRFLPASADRCPYDSLLQSASKTLGWDWKILRAVMYQESKYRMNARSGSNAFGLMQIKRSTAKDMKIRDLFDPGENIKGAVKYFAYLRRNMGLAHLSEEEEINFVLAAYNAGMTRIQSDREKTAQAGRNPDLWSHVSAYAPQQTQQYVEIVWNRYLDWISASE
ncbi:MAG TPA: transglycosylase SLT domain-containing protein [Bacteroidales bacterium]|nr:transglycosylase SLT domain-containing protein [Bacteroidales bacterium]HPW78910.1 transglycosylase SLT domain-containing protein [Bacteroidales bacterium]HQB56450.1 transglycosylase SLT domain-containing protein [Bacteroidales bacterium]